MTHFSQRSGSTPVYTTPKKNTWALISQRSLFNAERWSVLSGSPNRRFMVKQFLANDKLIYDRFLLTSNPFGFSLSLFWRILETHEFRSLIAAKFGRAVNSNRTSWTRQRTWSNVALNCWCARLDYRCLCLTHTHTHTIHYSYRSVSSKPLHTHIIPVLRLQD